MSKNNKQTNEGAGINVVIGILIAVIAVILVAGVILVVNLLSQSDPGTPAETTATETTAAGPATVDMTAVQKEIDSLKVSDFTETQEVTEYVKFTIKDHGELIIRLRKDTAPLSVANFQKLVETKHYDNTIFHRIMKGFMIQGGDPESGKGSLEAIKGEFSQNGVQNDLQHIKGVISMARTTAVNSATSQFFICNDDARRRSLDGLYAAFGYVVAGLDVVDSVSDVEVTYNARGELSSPIDKVILEKACFVVKN